MDNLEGVEDGSVLNHQNGGLQSEEEGGEEESSFTHHYSLQEDGTIHYHAGRRTSTTTGGLFNHYQDSKVRVLNKPRSLKNSVYNFTFTSQLEVSEGSEPDSSENNYEFEEITTMPLESDLHPFQLTPNSNSNSNSGLSFPFTVTTTGGVLTATVSTPSLTTNGGFILKPQNPLQSPPPASSAVKRKLTTKSMSLPEPLLSPDPPPPLQKRPKLLINLYETEVGYEFGALLPDHRSPSQMSHLIPYSETYLLRALDREEIPTKVLSHLAPILRWRRGHLLAQVRDYRRFSSATQVVPNKLGAKGRGAGVNSPHQYRVLKRSNPVVTEVVLRPCSASRLTDFESLLSRATKPGRGHWKRARIGTNSVPNLPPSPPAIKGGSKFLPNNRSRWPSSSEDENEEDSVLEDSDYELELEEGGGGAKESGALSYEQRLELEKEFINKTSGPLCLHPSPKVARIQNRAQFERWVWLKFQNYCKIISQPKIDSFPFRLKWRCPTLIPRVPSPPPSAQDEALESYSSAPPTSVPGRAAAFCLFLTGLREGSKDRAKEPGPKVLSPYELPFLDYPILDLPSSMEEINRLGPPPEPTTLRPLPIDNFVKKIEEYTLETERRKRPHTTKLSIFQRNGMDAYYGELEMESIIDGGVPGVGGGVPKPSSSSTKCQFELGSSQHVALYVKQFSDIFTEDGRRPCKITYQKVGQPQQVLYTNSYKTATPTSAGIAPTTPPAAVSASSTPPRAQPQTAPPVQIVHPQPRSAQPLPDTLTPHPGQSQGQSQPQGPGSSPQILTRPQQQQQPLPLPPQPLTASQLVAAQKPQLSGGGPTNTPTASASHQQLLQQRLLRLKQVQAQQAAAAAIQSPPPHQTALAKLLLTNISSPSSTPATSRPITVAVQPQPQKTLVTSASSDPAPPPNYNLLNLNSGGGSSHVSLNLNSMVLDGLLSQGQAAQLRAHGQIQIQGQGQPQGQTGHLNILRTNASPVLAVSSGGGTTILSGGNRYTTTTSSNNSFTTLLQGQGGGSMTPMSGSGQRILINANNGQQLTLSSPSSSSSELLEELSSSVPDLNSLLANVSSSTTPTHSAPQHNLNLNLNLNLNSGGLDLNSHALHGGGAGSGTPPFLVFISPLRSVPVSINANVASSPRSTSLLAQQLNAGPQTHPGLSLSLDSGGGGDLPGAGSDSGGEYYTLSDGGGSEIKLEPVDHNHSSHPSTVMIGNTAYSLNVSSSSGYGSGGGGGDSKKDVITLSSLLGSSKQAPPSANNLSPLILTQNPGGGGGGIVSSPSSTPRLSALLAGTPSADSGLLLSPGASRGGGKDLSILVIKDLIIN